MLFKIIENDQEDFIPFSTDQSKNADILSPLGNEIIRLRDTILQKWESVLREKMPEANALSRPILIDTMPSFIDNIAQAVTAKHPRPTANAYNNLATEHGGERARLTNYNHENLILEYQIFRSIFISVLKKAGVETTDEDLAVIHESIDEAIKESATTFTLIHLEFREQYMATLSHDMKTPLTSIALAADIISRKTEDPQILKQAKKIKENSHRINKMIEDLLNETTMSTGFRPNLDLKLCDAKALTVEILEELDEGSASRIKIMSTELSVGYWDTDFLKRSFENLISNALKYSLPDTPITITIQKNFQRLLYSVHNLGEPIPQSERECIFQVFRRARSASRGQKKGWGLGLPLVRAVAEAHGGSIVVESGLEVGTTFVLDIPMDARPYQDAPTTQLI